MKKKERNGTRRFGRLCTLATVAWLIFKVRFYTGASFGAILCHAVATARSTHCEGRTSSTLGGARTCGMSWGQDLTPPPPAKAYQPGGSVLCACDAPVFTSPLIFFYSRFCCVLRTLERTCLILKMFYCVLVSAKHNISVSAKVSRPFVHCCWNVDRSTLCPAVAGRDLLSQRVDLIIMS